MGKNETAKGQESENTQAKHKIADGTALWNWEILNMVLSTRDIFKSVGILIISVCAVFVCTLFLNYNIDLKALDVSHLPQEVQSFYNAQVMTGKMVSALCGGCLLFTSAVMLCFHIGHYIDTHGKTLGILKALGYSGRKIAKGFAGFGLSVFGGTAAGYAGAHAMMPQFYETQNNEGLLPKIHVNFHPSLLFFLVLLPTLAFCALSVLYGYFRLKTPVLELLKGKASPQSPRRKAAQNPKKAQRGKTARPAKTGRDLPFLQELKKSTLRQRKTLVFFIGFAAFCYAAMMQMSFGMDELASSMMAIMIFLIGVILSFVTLFLATTSTVKANWKTLAMMRAFGYPDKECIGSVLGGYRLPAMLGFALGTVYQYALLKIAVTVVFREVENVPEFHFDVPALAITLISFVALYELILYGYARKIRRISIREIMMDAE